jgi:hypothetical protein
VRGSACTARTARVLSQPAACPMHAARAAQTASPTMATMGSFLCQASACVQAQDGDFGPGMQSSHHSALHPAPHRAIKGPWANNSCGTCALREGWECMGAA